MIPINQINIGDMFQNPLFPDGNIYVVEDINGTWKTNNAGKAEQFQKDIEMYNRIIKILESK